MKYKVNLTKEASTDLREIFEYITLVLLEPEIAIKQLERIEIALRGLNEMPNRFKLMEREPWTSRGLRQMPVDNFIVFYIANIENKTVTIIRIMYGKRNFDDILRFNSQKS